jgi:hypothetical protein
MAPSVIDRLALKTLDQRFRHELETGFELAPRVSQGILQLAQEVFGLNQAPASQTERLRPGRIRQIITTAGTRPGRPLTQSDLVEVTWTLDAGAEDLEVWERHGRVALRQVRLLRLVEEALDQGGEPTQEDLARALGVTGRTIRADIAALKEQGFTVATRGMIQGVGRGQTHKVIIVELYLQHQTYTEIIRRTHHSAAAIQRYTQAFGRVVLLKRKGFAVAELAYAIGLSERLAQEYLDLYQRYDTPAYQDRLTEVVQMIQSGSPRPGRAAKKGGV